MKRLMAFVLALMLGIGPVLAEGSIDLDDLLAEIEEAGAAEGEAAKRFSDTLALIPSGTALYSDETLTQLFGTTRSETRAFILNRIEAETPEEDILLAALPVQGAVEVLWLTAGETLPLTPDEGSETGVGTQIPGTGFWLPDADILLAEPSVPEETDQQTPEVTEDLVRELLNETTPIEPESKAGAKISRQPENQVASVGDTVTVSVTASNVKAYLWQYSYNAGTSWTNCATGGYNTASYSFTVLEKHYNRLLRCKITGTDGKTVYSESAGLYGVMRITSNPGYRTASVGSTITLTVKAENVQAYLWQYSYNGGTSWTNCATGGHNTDSYTFTVQQKHYDRVMRCRLTDWAGNVRYTSTSRLYPPIRILQQPEDVFVEHGQRVTLTVVAENVRSYQWQYSHDQGKTWYEVDEPGANTASWSYVANGRLNKWMYRCKLTAYSYSTKYTNAILVTIYQTAVILEQPKTQTAAVGDQVTLTVTSGNALKYLWQYSYDGGKTWKNCAADGYDTPSYSYTVAEKHYGRLMRCALSGTNQQGFTYTDEVALFPPMRITAQPGYRTGSVGSSITLTVKAENVKAYQWQYSYDSGATWTDCGTNGFDTGSYTFTIQEKHYSRQMRCRLTDMAGGVKYSSVCKLFRPVVIRTQPRSIAAKTGAQVTLKVTADNVKAYLWQYSTDDGKTWTACASGGYNTDSYTMTVKEKHYSTLIRCRLTAFSSSNKYTDTVRILRPVAVTAQPAARTAAVGSTASFSVAASNVTAYQWQYSYDQGKTWKNCATGGHDTDTYSFAVTAQHYDRLLRCRFTALDGSYAYSDAAALYPPVNITAEPGDCTTAAGMTVTMTVEADGVKAYLWQYSYDEGLTWSDCASGGHNTKRYTFTVQEKHFTRLLRCRLTGFDGEPVYTRAAALHRLDTGDYTVQSVSGGWMLTGYSGSEVDLVIPGSIADQPIVSIGQDAFANRSLVAVRLPEGLQSIASGAFAGTNLLFVVLPSSLTEIADHAFDGCDNLMAEALGAQGQSWCAANSVPLANVQGLDVETHTQAEIQSFVNSHPANRSEPVIYQRARTDAPYDPGTLSGVTIQSGLNMINQMRYIAGLSTDVTNNPDNHSMVMATAMANCLNGVLSHYPTRPAAWADSQYDNLYALARDGGSHSNLALGLGNPADAVVGFVQDHGNDSTMGHRRWVLNPTLGTSTFGYCNSQQNDSGTPFIAMHCFDKSGHSSGSRVAWPAALTPSDYVSGSDGWSLSAGGDKSRALTSVRLTDQNTGRTWTFSSLHTDGAFYINNDGYGTPNCVIFFPDGIQTGAGNSYSVEVRDAGSHTVWRYTVRFFDLDTSAASQLAQTGSFTAENTDSGVLLNWAKVSGASGYYVYRKAQNEQYFGTVANVTGLTYTDTSVSDNTLYSYRLIPHTSCVTGIAASLEIARMNQAFDTLWGSCGCDLSNGILTVHAGAGAADPDSAPWKTMEGITGVIFEDGVIFPSSCTNLFKDCTALTSIVFRQVDTSAVTDLESLFDGCTGLTSLNLTSLNTANVISINAMCHGCENLTDVNMNGWDTRKLRTANSAFDGCGSLTSVQMGSWNTALLQDVGCMFRGCASLTSISDLSGWNTSHVYSVSSLFEGCSSLESIAPLSGWSTASLRYLYNMLTDCASLTDISALSGFDTHQIDMLYGLFDGCASLTSVQAVAGWDVSSVTQMSYLFQGCTSLTSVDLSGWNTAALTSVNHMLAGCTSLQTLKLNGWDVSQLTNMVGFASGCTSLTTLNLTSWNPASVTSMSWAFANCSSLTTLPIGSWNTSQLQNLSAMCYQCTGLKTLNLSGLNTAAVTNFEWVFGGCTSLETLNMSGWDTRCATSMNNLFYNCSALRSVTVGANFDFCGSGSTVLTTLPGGSWTSAATGLTYTGTEIASQRNRTADTYTR